jgi:hypothetical protein
MCLNSHDNAPPGRESIATAAFIPRAASNSLELILTVIKFPSPCGIFHGQTAPEIRAFEKAPK